MKFRRNAAALLTVFHPESTHTGNHSTPKDVKNEGRPGYVYENKWEMDKMPEITSDICAWLKPFLQKIGVSSSPNTCRTPVCRVQTVYSPVNKRRLESNKET
jgi:hypothetical protein